MARRWWLVLAAVALVALGCKTGVPGGGAGTPSPVPGFPTSMVALGDSLTAGFGACLAPAACPRNSWSTGDGTQVRSHYRRILAANPAIRGHARNLAEAGSTVADLPAQASAAARQPAQYVTLLVGANDACTIRPMTPVSDFRAMLDRALATLKHAMPRARLLVVGIPDVHRVWELGHTNKLAVAVWNTDHVCPNLLTNPTSTAAADVARRAAFAGRIAAYNTQLARACAAYGTRCHFDGLAGFAFSLTMLSAIDFLHPNASGQNALAEQTYPSSFTW